MDTLDWPEERIILNRQIATLTRERDEARKERDVLTPAEEAVSCDGTYACGGICPRCKPAFIESIKQERDSARNARDYEREVRCECVFVVGNDAELQTHADGSRMECDYHAKARKELEELRAALRDELESRKALLRDEDLAVKEANRLREKMDALESRATEAEAKCAVLVEAVEQRYCGTCDLNYSGHDCTCTETFNLPVAVRAHLRRVEALGYVERAAKIVDETTGNEDCTCHTSPDSGCAPCRALMTLSDALDTLAALDAEKGEA